MTITNTRHENGAGRTLSRSLGVTLINGRDLGGGAETATRESHHELRRIGHDSLFAVDDKLSDDLNIRKLPNRKGAHGVRRLRSSSRSFSWLAIGGFPAISSDARIAVDLPTQE